MCNYTYAGPALLVLPLCLMSLINLFLAGPPLKTIVIDSVSAESASYSTSRLDFMQLEVDRKSAHFTLLPKDEMTHFFVVTCHTPAHDVPLQLNATVAGIRSPHSTKWSATPTSDGRAETLASDTTAGPQKDRALQLFQPMLGYSTYHVFISALAPEGAPAASAPALPAIEYRLSYVPTRFTHIQICVRAFFSFTSACMLVCYCIAMCSGPGPRETGQAWVGALLLLLLLGVNEPLYIARVMLGGNHAMYVVGALGQTLFFGGLFLFWLVFADGMGSRQDLCLLLPKLLLVALFVGSSALLFVSYGRVPDRIALDEMRDPAQRALVLLLCASVASVGLWLAGLISRTLYRLGWKKLEYIYTEREKSFVGITMVFVILTLCGRVYCAVHGQRGSWMQLQLPFLALANSYLALLAHAFWPSTVGGTRVRAGGGGGGGAVSGGRAGSLHALAAADEEFSFSRSLFRR